jgi:hypothetical protein
MESSPTDDLSGLKGDERILQQARIRFRHCVEWRSKADQWWLEDVRFANADARNHDQWPDDTWQERDDDNRPCLTINKARVHNNIIINESLQNKSSIKVRPTGGIATYESAQAIQSMIRRIEYISKSDSVYEKAIRDQVDGGLGFVFLETKYVNNRTMDQDIYLKKCKNPLCVYIDPDASDSDGLDAAFGFVFESMSKEKFDVRYPKFKNRVGKSTLGNDESWLMDDMVQVAMYYTKEQKKDTFVTFVDPDTEERIDSLMSELKADSGKFIYDQLMADIKNGVIDGQTREVVTDNVKWYHIAGDYIMDRGDWPGAFIPIIRCVGIETIIEGQYDCKGHTRALIDAQRMLNYNASGAVEYGALQSKSPYIGPARAFEGQEQWKDANRKNYAFLQYNDIDEEANDPQISMIQKPERAQPPTSAPIYMQGMQDAERQMMMCSGQYQAQLGEDDKQSASSGRAINERQRQSDTATYHFVEHQADMLRGIGVQLLDLIPKIYDTERMLHVLGEDGTRKWIQIAPDQKEPYIELKKEQEEAAIISINPRVGEYDCMSDSGPNYATQRQEAWNAISIILQQNMQLAGTIGDLLFKFGDFPGSDEIMERLKKEIQATKPYLFDDNREPQMMALQQQMQRLTSLNSELMQKLALKEIALKGKDEKRDIEASRADTDRLKLTLDFLTKTMLSEKDRAMLQHELMKASHDTTMQMIVDSNKSDLSMQSGPQDIPPSA